MPLHAASLLAGWSLGGPTTLLLGAGFALLSLLVGGLLMGKRKTPTSAAPATPPLPTARFDHPPPPPPPLSASNSRETVRTSGTWLKVVLRDDDAGGRLFEGHVVDYTPAGVGLIVHEALVVGKNLSARHAKAPGSVPWAVLQVRSCQQLDRTVWKVGGQVQDPTLWDTLMRYS